MSNELGTIGYIGLGNMGALGARHLHAAGAEVIVWNRSAEPMKAAKADGLRTADSLVELAASVGDGIVCLNLTTSEVVASVLAELEPHLHADALIIDCGTSGVPLTKACAERLSWVDAPVSGGQVGAKAANLTIMAGGSEENVQRAWPVLEVFGENITHMGPAGSGQITKLANQLIVAQTIDAVAQALRMAELAGIDAGKVREALLGGFAESRILDLLGERMVKRDFAAGGKSTYQLKDIHMAKELADSLGFESAALENCLTQWEAFVHERGLGDLDHSALFRIYED